MATHDNRSSPGQQASPSAGGASQLGPGSVVGGTWVVERLLGKGGMGAVWLVRHQRLANKRAAIKVLHGTGLTDEAYIRFAREAEIATRIGHPNIVDVLDLAALESGEPYIVLEFLQGETLRDRLRRDRQLSFAVTADLTRQIGSALLAAHRHDVVHRDLKPENVFLVPTDSGGVLREHVKVLDFGISKLRGSQTLQTQEAVLLGTPQYMAPEQASGHNHAVDGRTDQFALAVMVYEMLTGQPPWVSDTPLGLLYQVVHAPTPQLGSRLADVPATAVLAIERALSKDANQRFADIGSFVEALTGQALQTLDGRTDSHAAWAKTQDVKILYASQGGGALDASTRREMEEATWDGAPAPQLEVSAELATAQTAAGDLRTPVGLQAPGLAAAAAIAAAAARPAVAAAAEPKDQAPTVPAAVAAPALAPAPVAPAQQAAVAAAPTAGRVPTATWAAALAAAAAIATAGWLATRGDPAPPAVAAAGLAANPQALPADPIALAKPAPAAVPPAAAAAPAVAAPALPVAAPPTAEAAGVAAAPAQAPVAAPAAAAAGPTPAAGKKAEAAGGLPVPEEVAEAEAALAAGKLAEAARLATHSLLTRKTARAFAVLTMVHCKRGDLGGAKTWFGQTTGSARAAAKKACQAEGVEL